MNERVIKQKLRSELIIPESATIVEELQLCGHCARADFAVIDNTIRGFEIKSEKDNLSRLENQIGYYDQVFEFSTLVAAEKHLSAARQILPSHWGLIAVKANATIRLVSKRKAKRNKRLSSESILELLWMDELLEIVASKGLHGTRKSWGRGKLRSMIAANLTEAETLECASAQIRVRRNWRAA